MIKKQTDITMFYIGIIYLFMGSTMLWAQGDARYIPFMFIYVGGLILVGSFK